MKRILSVTDLSGGGELAIHYGNVLADQFNSELYIYHPIPIPEIGLCDFQWNPASYIERTVSDSSDFLHMFLDRNRIRAELILDTCLTEAKLINVVKEKRIDFIVFPLKIRTGINIFIAKNISRSLFYILSCPMLLVPYKNVGQVNIDNDNLWFNKILVVCSYSTKSKGTIKQVLRIVKKFSSELDLIVIYNHDHQYQDLKPKIHHSLIEAIEELMPVKAEKIIKNMKTVLSSENPPDQIIKYIKKSSIDMIFLDTKNPANNKQCFSTSLIKQIISKAHCPVLLPNIN